MGILKSLKNKFFKNREPKNKDPVFDVLQYNDYQKTIATYWISEKNLNKAVFPQYMFYEYQIESMESILNNLRTEGYLTTATSEIKLYSLKVSELRNNLKDNNLKISGNKPDLVNRLLENLNFQEIEEITKDLLVFSPTEKGCNLLDEYNYVIELNKRKNWQITIEEYVLARNSIITGQKFTPFFRDVCWRVFNDRQLINASKKLWGIYRNTLKYMGELLLEENRLSRVFDCYFEIIIIDLNGLSNSIEYVNDKDYVNTFNNYYSNNFDVKLQNHIDAPFIAQLFLEFVLKNKEYYKYEMTTQKLERLRRMGVIQFYFTPKETQRIIDEIMTFELHDYNDTLKIIDYISNKYNFEIP